MHTHDVRQPSMRPNPKAASPCWHIVVEKRHDTCFQFSGLQMIMDYHYTSKLQLQLQLQILNIVNIPTR